LDFLFGYLGDNSPGMNIRAFSLSCSRCDITSNGLPFLGFEILTKVPFPEDTFVLGFAVVMLLAFEFIIA